MPRSILLIEHWMLSSTTKYRIWLSFIRCGKNCWRNTVLPLAWALSSSPLKAVIPRISDSWQKWWGCGGWGEAWQGVLQSSFRVPIFVSLRVWHSSLYRTVSTCLQTKFHLLEFGRGEVRELSAWVPLCIAIFTAPCLVRTQCSPGDWS